MLTMTIEVDCPMELAQGAKEAAVMCLESLGNVRVVEVHEEQPEQLGLAGWGNQNPQRLGI